MALRMSGHLMLGVVRIFSRKVTYLLSDCSEAMVKIKDAFRGPGGVDMAPGAATRRYDDITNPENFDELDLDSHFVPAQVRCVQHPPRSRGRRSPPPLICAAPADRRLSVLPSPAADVVCDRRRCDGGHLDPRRRRRQHDERRRLWRGGGRLWRGGVRLRPRRELRGLLREGRRAAREAPPHLGGLGRRGGGACLRAQRACCVCVCVHCPRARVCSCC